MIIVVAVAAVVTVIATLRRRHEIYPAATVVIALAVTAAVSFSIISLWQTYPFAGLTVVSVALLIVIDLVLLFGSARAAAARRARRAKKANDAIASEHAARVAQVQQWQQAWSDANGGAASPEGLLPPADFGPLQMAAPRTNVMAILAIIFGFGGGLLGIVFGHIALHQIRQTGEKGRGLAITGLVFGYPGLAVAVGLVIAMAALTNY